MQKVDQARSAGHRGASILYGVPGRKSEGFTAANANTVFSRARDWLAFTRLGNGGYVLPR